MIAKNFVTEWRTRAPWPSDAQVEQDLIVTRAVVQIYQDPLLAAALAFRGGTALYKIHILPPARYSEDIDLVQTRPEPIGPTLDRLRAALDPWLGEPRRVLKPGRVQIVYRIISEAPERIPLRLKIEINSQEHFSVEGYRRYPIDLASSWFSGRAEVQTFSREKLLGTKMRALYQRNKGRDLFDLWKGLQSKEIVPAQIVKVFERYLEHEGRRVSRKTFENNLNEKLREEAFRAEVVPLMAPGERWDVDVAAAVVRERLLALLSAH